MQPTVPKFTDTSKMSQANRSFDLRQFPASNVHEWPKILTNCNYVTNTVLQIYVNKIF